jgi:GntR family transcriptional regulator
MAQKANAPETPFSTDPDDVLPVGLQLSWRLRALITTGRLSCGERLPSFRQLATWAGVNVNTVRTVYASLEREGLVVTRQGQGTFVADGIEPAPELEAIVSDALRRAEEVGLSPRELAIVATACAGIGGAQAPSAASEDPASLPAEIEVIEVRHELRRQIARLEAELSSYTRDLPAEMPTAHRSAEPHVTGVEELEQTRDTLVAQLSEAHKAAERRAREEGHASAKRRAVHGARGDASPANPGPLARAMSWWRDKS